MKNKIDEYMKFMNNIDIDNFDYKYLYKELISHKDRNLSEYNTSIDKIFNEISSNNKSIVNEKI